MTAQITTFLAVPDSSQGRAAFVAAANAFGNGLTPLSNEMNAVAAEVNDNAVAAEASKEDAQDAQTAAEAARDAAQAAATATAAQWQPSTAYAKDDLAWGDGSTGDLYRCIEAYAGGATPPASDPVHWARLFVSPGAFAALQADVDALRDLKPVPKTAAYTLALSDRGKGIDTTANVTVPANADVALPVGATCVVTNVGGSAITIVGAAGVTLRLAGAGATGNKTLASWGYALLRQVTPNVWLVVGAGL